MPRYRVRLTRTREEYAYAYVTASEPNEVCVEEADVQFANWKPDWDTSNFEQGDIDEISK